MDQWSGSVEAYPTIIHLRYVGGFFKKVCGLILCECEVKKNNMFPNQLRNTPLISVTSVTVSCILSY